VKGDFTIEGQVIFETLREMLRGGAPLSIESEADMRASLESQFV
jgi:hypothetical protein